MASNIQPILEIRRETLVDRLVQILQESIFSGERLPKSRISEAGVAKEFGVSRIPAREALQRLEDMNLVRKNHWGREIVQFSLEEFRQIYELKNVVEAFGAMQGSLKATPHEIEAIASILSEMAEVIARNDINRLKKLTHDFHDAMVFCCNNPKIIESFLSLAKQVRWATPISLRLQQRPLLGYREHEEIFTAFRNKEAEKVRHLLEVHSNNSMNRVLSKMKTVQRLDKEKITAP